MLRVSVSGQWVSWDEAAELAGVRVPTIEHAVRVNRIVHRPRAGRLPTLDRDSVLAWATWYREELAGRQARRLSRELLRAAAQERRIERQRRPRGRAARLATRQNGQQAAVTETATASADGAEWISMSAAALRLESTTGSVRRWVELGTLEARFEARLWVASDSVEVFKAERAADVRAWVNQAKAASIVGCAHHHISELVAEGLLVQRSGPTWRASISRASAEAAAPVWSQRQRAAALERERRTAQRPISQPPDDEHVWLSRLEAALVIGVSPSTISNRVRAGTLPGVRRGKRFWLRREDVERAAAARAFHFRQEHAGVTLTR